HPNPRFAAKANMNMQHQHRAATALLVLLAGLLLSGCGGSTSYYSAMKRTVVDAKDDLLSTRPTTSELFKEDSTPLIDINYDAADDMMGLFMPAMNKKSPIYYTRFVNRVDLADPSPFGRLVAEQVAARLALRSFLVTVGPAKVPPTVVPKPVEHDPLPATPEAREAEYKRTQEEFSPVRPCELTGSYLIADKVVYISAQIAAMDNGQVMTAHHWTVPVNRNTRALLPQLKQNGGMKPSVRTQLGTSPHDIANPSGQPQNYIERDLVR
ncbi:MAG: FlgO family outer membrane protein, partial [Humidesulfovibrio sp.]|nr:FlgO family outer membrane protein [Humidesulfovibrio sp.]